MPARMFFSILTSSRKQESQQWNSRLIDLCDVQAISLCSGEYVADLKSSYRSRITGENWRRGPTAKMDPKDPRAQATLLSIFKQKSKVEGHG